MVETDDAKWGSTFDIQQGCRDTEGVECRISKQSFVCVYINSLPFPLLPEIHVMSFQW